MSEMVEAEVKAQEKREKAAEQQLNNEEPTFDNILDDKVVHTLLENVTDCLALCDEIFYHFPLF